MENLNTELEMLHKLNIYRERARELRKQGLQPLKRIIDIKPEKKESERIIAKESNRELKAVVDFTKWTTSGNNVEIALLAKLQNHRDICEETEDNNLAQANVELKNRLSKIKLKDDLMPPEEAEPSNVDEIKSVPVVTAARTMQVLVSRSETVMSRAMMVCYYRIMRELYGAAPPDWTVGAARAGYGGTTSAFVTGECVRALFGFRDSVQRTATFFRETKRLLERYASLRLMLDSLGNDAAADHPLRKWADKTMEAMWLDWFLATNQRRGQIALFYNKTLEKGQTEDDFEVFNYVSDNEPNQLFQFDAYDENGKWTLNVVTVGKYFKGFAENLKNSVVETQIKIKKAVKEIFDYRELERSQSMETSNENSDENLLRERHIRLQRTASAHLFAEQSIKDALAQAERSESIINSRLKECNRKTKKIKDIKKNEKLEVECLKAILDEMTAICEENVSGINQIVAPTNQYIKSVLRRELANSPSQFDAGELVFAATTFGAMTDWKQNELLSRACSMLVEALPESGRLPTKRPLHTSTRGYRLLPIGCEMTRSLAQLFDSMNFDFDDKLVGRLLNIFEEKLLYLKGSNKEKLVGWNFESSPNPGKPCVWVSVVSVLALDRVVRMLDTRINNAILKNFETVNPKKPHIDVPINDLIYADYGFQENYFKHYPKIYENIHPIPIQLELMRAHIMRACLPRHYSENIDGKVYSSILYGPPGTGKTTLAEVLAYNSEATLVKLSPSDLIVQGEEFIEGRARDIFDALSMLTQTVIIFDEFEPMLKTRKPKEIAGRNHNGKPSANQHANDPMETIAEELREIRKKDDPKVRFLLAGMLPKFLKLHDAAKNQSLVYFLGTNVLKDIDDAARRSGRFDSKIPIYNPCPLSRAGTFLYCLSKSEKAAKLCFYRNKTQVKRFLQVVAATVNEPASELAKKYFHKKSTNIKFVFGDYKEFSPKPENKLAEMEKKFSDDRDTQEANEQAESNWVVGFEKHIKVQADKIDSIESTELMSFLKKCLEFEPQQ